MNVALLVVSAALAQVGPLRTVGFGAPGLPLRDESLRVRLDGPYATTTVEQIFVNESAEVLEGVFELRTPPGTEVEGFAYWNGEERITGEVFETAAARRIYDDVRGRRRDPGLLERVDDGLFRFSVFPIQPGERKRIEVRYARWLPSQDGAIEYRAYLSDAGADIEVETTGLEAMPLISSPTHELHFSTVRGDATRIRLTPRQSGRELVLRWEVASSEWRLLAHAQPTGDGRSFVHVALAAPPQAPGGAAARDVTLLLDRSGSMAGEALRRAKQAALDVIERTGPADRINVGFFDDHVDLIFDRPRANGDEVAAQLRAFVDDVSVGGGTDIAGALRGAFAAQADDERVRLVVLLTDGRSDAAALLDVARGDTSGARVFAIGLGDQVSIAALTRLASMTGGRFVAIDRAEEVGAQVARFAGALDAPVWVGTTVEVDGHALRQAYPSQLAELFPGGELRVSGQVAGTGDLHVTVRGEVAGEPTLLHQVIHADPLGGHPWVGKSWARSRVDDLMQENAEHGESAERIHEIITLAVAYDFVTPYTAFLAIPAGEATGIAARTLADARAFKDETLRRSKDRLAALNSGTFAALEGGRGGAVSNVFGPGGLSSGISDALGGLRGTGIGDAGGAGGFGTRGTSPGGGGTDLGIGGLGSGSGRGTGGLGNVDLGGRGPARYDLVPGEVSVDGCLTVQQILRVILRVQSQAKYCYERELAKNDGLQGRLTTTFAVGPTGAVTSVRVANDTMVGGDEVVACLERVVQRLRFPPCEGGDTAVATYSWTFVRRAQ